MVEDALSSQSQLDSDIAAVLPGALAGDTRSINRLMELVHPVVYSRCVMKLQAKGATSPHDVAQEVCLAVVRALPRYVDTGAPFMAFVNSVMHNKIVDAIRAMGRDRSVTVEEFPDRAADGPTPESYTLEMDACNAVRGVLDQLPESDREVLQYRVIEGRSAEEVGAIMGKTPGAVRVQQHRALAKVKKLPGLDSLLG